MTVAGFTLPELSEFDPPIAGEGSIDPMGLATISEHLADLLFPGITNRMNRVAFAVGNGGRSDGMRRPRRRDSGRWHLEPDDLLRMAGPRSLDPPDPLEGPALRCPRQPQDQSGHRQQPTTHRCHVSEDRVGLRLQWDLPRALSALSSTPSVPSSTRIAACRLVEPGGVIVHVGLLPGSQGLDVRRITLQEITFVGTYCYTPTDFKDVVAALTASRFGTLNWFEERSLADGPAAFRAIDAGTMGAAKVVLRPDA